jgi:hypothetical protein
MSKRRRRSPCSRCGADPVYKDKCDRYYCQMCDEWLEDKCKCKPDDECLYCGICHKCDERPLKPSEI